MAYFLLLEILVFFCWRCYPSSFLSFGGHDSTRMTIPSTSTPFLSMLSSPPDLPLLLQSTRDQHVWQEQFASYMYGNPYLHFILNSEIERSQSSTLGHFHPDASLSDAKVTIMFSAFLWTSNDDKKEAELRLSLTSYGTEFKVYSLRHNTHNWTLDHPGKGCQFWLEMSG